MNHSLTRANLEIGATIADTYTIEGLLGKGGMGSVFRCSHARLPGKQVAIKVLHTEVSNGEVLARFRREAEITSKLGHPNIVTVLDFNALEDGTPYLVLEYLVGESLWDRMRQGALPLEFALSLARQVGSALASAHRADIVHRDLKPHNIFLVATETHGRHSEIAKVLDFGISKIRGSATVQTQENTMLGTPQYMSPEQALGRQNDVDGRADQFALAVIMHEILTGTSAFPGSSIPEVVFKVVYEEPAALLQIAPSTPPHVVAALARAMRKNHTERFPSIDEFIEALTGEGLAQARGNRKAAVVAPDAMAMTVDSGNHGPGFGAANTLPTPNPATPNPAQLERAAPARTADASVVTTAPSVMPTPVPLTTPTAADGVPARRERVPMFVFAAAALACAALVGGFVVARNRHAAAPAVLDNTLRGRPDAMQLAMATDAAPVLMTDATAPARLDAAPAQDAALVHDTASVATIVDARPPKPTLPKPPQVEKAKIATDPATDPATDAATDDPIRQQLRHAVQDLALGNFDTAQSHALNVLDAQDGKTGQRNQAVAVLVRIECERHNLGRANYWFRQLKPPLRLAVKKRCADNGTDVN